MRTYQKSLLGLPLAVLVLLSSGASLKAAENVIGEWEFTMSIGGGPGGGEGQEMHPKAVFSKAEDGTISGTWEMNFQAPEGAEAPAMGGDFQMPTFKLVDVKVDGEKLTFTQTGDMGGQSFEMPFTGTINGDKIEGAFTSSFGGGDMVATATRKSAVEIVGAWEFEMAMGPRRGGAGPGGEAAAPDGGAEAPRTRTVTVTFAKSGDGYTATWEQQMPQGTGAGAGPGGGAGPMGAMEVEVIDIQLDGKNLSFTQSITFGERSFESTFTGTVEGDAITGTMARGMGGDTPFNGKRKGADDVLVGTWSIEMPMGGRRGGGAPGGDAPDDAAAAPRTRTVELTFTKSEDGSYVGTWEQQMRQRDGAGAPPADAAGPGGGAGPMGNRGAMETKIIDITIDGNTVSFTRSMTFGERVMDTVYTGTIEGDTLTGTMTRSGGGMGNGMGGGETPFTGTRNAE